MAEITQGHMSRPKFKSSRASLLISPIWDVFGGTQHLRQNSSTLTSPAAKEGAYEHSQTSRPGFPRMSGPMLSEPGRRWRCHLQSPEAVGSSGIAAHSHAAGDRKSQLY